MEGASPPPRAVLFALLTAPDAQEWRDKVGVAGPREGSGKASARLLASGGWVFKTDASWSVTAPDGLLVRAELAAASARRLGLWHPDKVWLVLAAEGAFHLVTACPRLAVLRALPSFEARVAAWARMLVLALRAARDHGVGLDVHPSNFGEAHGALHYLDDELYAPTTLADLGRAIADRIPEEDAPPAAWRIAGEALARALEPHVRTVSEWTALTNGLVDRPLVEALSAHREAVRGAFARRTRAARLAPRGERTCVLADVHANLPALEAVLAAARALGAERWLLLGDVVGYGPHPVECIEVLAGLEGLEGVRGNHDHGAASMRPEEGMSRMARFAADWTAGRLGEAERAWLAALPRELRGEGWLAVHGAPRDPERFYAYVYELTFRENLDVLCEARIAACFYGHTHVPFVHRRNPDGTSDKLGPVPVVLGEPGECLLVNPGSVGQPRDGDPRASFAMWERERGAISFHRAAYPIDATVRDMGRAGFPPDLAYRLETGR